MTANIDKRQKFIELRAEGMSFDKIAEKLHISKPTLIKWSRAFKEDIVLISKVIDEQFIIEQKTKRTIRAQKISDELDKAYEALSQTDYKNMNKKELISIIEKLDNKLNEIIGFNTIIGTDQISGRPKEIIKFLREEIDYQAPIEEFVDFDVLRSKEEKRENEDQKKNFDQVDRATE
jgi:hypothetical protein